VSLGLNLVVTLCIVVCLFALFGSWFIISCRSRGAAFDENKFDRQRSFVSRRSEVVAVGDWRARFERRAAAGRRGRASSGRGG